MMDSRGRTLLQTLKNPTKQQNDKNSALELVKQTGNTGGVGGSVRKQRLALFLGRNKDAQMDSAVSTSLKDKGEMLQRNRPKMEAARATTSTRRIPTIGTSRLRREKKIALQQDVDMLKKKLRHEENVHRALERAFTRPLGALPRLPPYLPAHILELLAEVAVLEEEVVRLEEQVVNIRQGLYQEAIRVSSSKKMADNASDLYPCLSSKISEASSSSNDQSSPVKVANAKKTKSLNKSSSSLGAEDRHGKENQLDSNNTNIIRLSPRKKATVTRTSGIKKKLDDKLNKERTEVGTSKKADNTTVNYASSSPNRISEDMLKCLMGIFSRTSTPEKEEPEFEMLQSISGSDDVPKDTEFQDPYNICSEFGRRDIGRYKSFRSIDENSIDSNLVSSPSPIMRRLKLLLRKLSMVDLRGLNHHQKLAFWINIYNSCMMNAFLENGVPTGPEMVVALMPKAMINVGGHFLSAMTIEHFILRLPYQSKHASPKGLRNDEMTARSVFGLDWPEPLVTFALSCGSWSSPAVRVYTASQVGKELEAAKQDYLQAAVGISNTRNIAIPKLLDWYLLDFAKDVGSLMDWICLQLPDVIRKDAVSCIESVDVLPYDFSFRYLFAT